MKPTVGPESDEYRAVCVYSARPGEQYCHLSATLHVRVDDVHYGEVALATCANHAPIARAAGRFVAEHEFAGFCGLPGTIWADVENVCVIDDSGVEPVVLANFLDAAQQEENTR